MSAQLQKFPNELSSAMRGREAGAGACSDGAGNTAIVALIQLIYHVVVSEAKLGGQSGRSLSDGRWLGWREGLPAAEHHMLSLSLVVLCAIGDFGV